MTRPLVIGLTGGVASGKSTAAHILASLGFTIVDADAIAREARSPSGLAYSQIIQRFGTADPNSLRNLIFSDPVARNALQALLHPIIHAESRRKIDELIRQGAPQPMIYEAALLVETGRHKELNGLIVIESSIQNQLTRLMSRDQCDPAKAQAIIRAQTDNEARRNVATWVIENNGTLDELKEKIANDLAPRLR